MVLPYDDDVWTHCPNFTFRERFSITSMKPLTDKIMHKIVLKLLYGCNWFNIASFNKLLDRRHTFQNTYKRQNHQFIQIHKYTKTIGLQLQIFVVSPKLIQMKHAAPFIFMTVFWRNLTVKEQVKLDIRWHLFRMYAICWADHIKQ